MMRYIIQKIVLRSWKVMPRILLLVIAVLSLNACQSMYRSHTGAIIGATTTTAVCVENFGAEPYLAAVCGVAGAWAGASVMYHTDKDVHNAVFVDHLNNGPSGSSYSNWYNVKTGNSGIIKTTKSYLVGPIKCKDYDHTVDIANQWPALGVGRINREVKFGTACQMPDGQWVERVQ